MTPKTFSTSELALAALPHSNRYRVLQSFQYCDSQGHIFTIPAGFITDGASVPRLLWWLYPPIGPDYELSAVFHDFLYQMADRIPGPDHGHISRGQCDGLFYEAMGAEGFRDSGRKFIYAAVRSGGWKAWRRHRKAYADTLKAA